MRPNSQRYIMETITIRDKTFAIYITADSIEQQIRLMAQKINDEYQGRKPLFIAVLNGAFLFAADLFKHITIDCEISFVKVASYIEMESQGTVKTLIGLNESLSGRDIIVLEDIVDSGNTGVEILGEVRKYHPASVKFASLLIKPKALKNFIHVDFSCFEIENEFVVGYGLDYDGLGRNHKNIYKLIG